ARGIQPDPDSTAQDRQGDPLRAHDALERSRFLRTSGPETEADEYITRRVDNRLAGTFEEFCNRQPFAAAISPGNFCFGIERDERSCAIPGWQGVGDVAANGSYVAYLRPANNAAAFDQTGR